MNTNDIYVEGQVSENAVQFYIDFPSKSFITRKPFSGLFNVFDREVTTIKSCIRNELAKNDILKNSNCKLLDENKKLKKENGDLRQQLQGTIQVGELKS